MLQAAARKCRACHLWRRATQTVFGEGRTGADVMLVGEQPGTFQMGAARQTRSDEGVRA
jgi:uracil-DNA glycosylase family 4